MVSFRLSPPEITALDRARGAQSRSDFIRAAVNTATKRENT